MFIILTSNIYAALVLFLLTEEIKKIFQVGIEFKEEFKSEYENLENPRTQIFVNKVKDAVSAIFDLDSTYCVCDL